MMFKFLPIFFCFFYLHSVTNAQDKTASRQPLMFTPLFERMRSTHGNYFYTGSFSISKMTNKRFEVGLGLETAFTSKHHDNGFVLYKLKFIPVFGNLKYHFNKVKKFDFYAESSLGLSFNTYHRASDNSPNIKVRIKEKGIFAYFGSGVRYPISKKINLVTGIGIKGYKMSFNALDINPHGLSGMLGLNIKNL